MLELIHPLKIHLSHYQSHFHNICLNIYQKYYNLQDKYNNYEYIDLSSLNIQQLIQKIKKEFNYSIIFFDKQTYTINNYQIKKLNNFNNFNYQNYYICIYNPFISQGKFNNTLYTIKWRIIHELAHALTYEKIKKKFNQDTNRSGKLSYELTLNDAKQAIYWEDKSLEVQEKLYTFFNIQYDNQSILNEKKLVYLDSLIRVITGQFTNLHRINLKEKNIQINLKEIYSFLEKQHQYNLTYQQKFKLIH